MDDRTAGYDRLLLDDSLQLAQPRRERVRRPGKLHLLPHRLRLSARRHQHAVAGGQRAADQCGTRRADQCIAGGQ
ncbi:hypothetical protein D3C72_2218620 [compost metagenome]